MIRPRVGRRRAAGESRLGSPEWRASFERRLAARAYLARLTRWSSVDAGPPCFLDGNHGFYVHDGRCQLAWTLAAIDQARKRIDFEVYIYEPDAVGTEIRDHLARAAQRGVAVRLLVDAVGGANAGAGFFQPLLAAGGHVVEFNPVKPWRLRMSRFGLRHRWEPNHRDHRKLLVCDATVGWARRAAERGPEDEPPTADAQGEESAIAITGGRNVADHYLGLRLGHGQWRDCGVVLFGPAAVRLGEMFAVMWNRADGDAAGDDRSVPTLASPSVGELAVLPLDSQPGVVNLLQWSLSQLTSAVQKELRISCSYFIPSARFRRTLVSVARRRLPCKILIPLHNDIPIVGAASRHFLGMLLKAGLQIHRHAAETLHEKTFIYDRSVTVIGSSNVDQRSFRLNYELSVIILGESFAAPVVRWHEADFADSERYTLADWSSRSWWGRLTDWFWWLFRGQL